MKKICLFVTVMMLSACFRAGSYDILSQRNDIFTMWNGYKIRYYNNEPQLIDTQVIEENNFNLNVAQTVYKGNSVLISKSYTRDFYSEIFVKANKRGSLNSSSLPVPIYADKNYEMIGQITIDGKVYRLLPAVMDDYVILIDADGRFYNKMGQIRSGYVVLLDTEMFPYPADLRMVDVTSSRTEDTTAVKGFDVRYDGVKLDRIWFTYMDYDEVEAGTFKEMSFPDKPGLITINNVGLRVLKADNEKITYMVISY
ncbi:MAG: hypothetical protein IKL33_03710 [Alphaproteobacteria bacterium]|nr:hypothetical protein [Alphaproteobacteria bacterium]